jgi:hypothetical protein
LTDSPFKPLRFGFDVAGRGLIPFAFGQLQQFGGVRNALAGAVDFVDRSAQSRAFAPEFLCTFRVRPDRRLFKLASDLFQSFFFLVVLKETPEERRSALPYP